MDTISRENTSSPLPMVAMGAAALALILSAVALVQLGGTKKKVTAAEAQLTEIPALTTRIDAAAADAKRANSDNARLAEQASAALVAMQGRIDEVKTSMTKIEEASKRAPAAAAGKAAAGPVVAGPGEYVVKSGDTFTKIGASLGFTAAEVAAVNPNVNSAALRVGQKIKVPQRAK